MQRWLQQNIVLRAHFAERKGFSTVVDCLKTIGFILTDVSVCVCGYG
jgi:hypothetical protein